MAGSALITNTLSAVVAAQSGGTTPPGLKFPSDYDTTGGVWFNLAEFQYKRPNFSSDFQATATGVEISLPVPMSLTTTYSADWGNETMGAVTAKMVEGASEALDTGSVRALMANPIEWAKEALGSAKGSTPKDLMSGLEYIWSGMKQAGINAAEALVADGVADVPFFRAVGRERGVARNPFLALTFTGVNFRSFPISYKFFPRNYQESVTLLNIITSLKYGMHPLFDAAFSNALFRYPNMYKPFFTPNEYLFEFGWCIIQQLEVNYHAGGRPAYNQAPNGDKVPACIEFSFTLQEIEIVTKDKIRNPSSQALGTGLSSGTTTTLTNVTSGSKPYPIPSNLINTGR